jgi:hypothetical protein
MRKKMIVKLIRKKLLSDKCKNDCKICKCEINIFFESKCANNYLLKMRKIMIIKQIRKNACQRNVQNKLLFTFVHFCRFS